MIKESNFKPEQGVSPEDNFEKNLNILDEIIADKQRSVFGRWPREKVLALEKGVSGEAQYEKTLKRLLERYGVDPNVEIKKIGTDIFSVAIDSTMSHDLPENYGFKGGAARSALLKMLGISDVDPRDLDLVSFIDSNDDNAGEILEKYSPDDFASGHGVETLTKDYFSTRDFTINELVLTGDRVIVTKQALLDNVRGVIRFSEFEKNNSRIHDEERGPSQKFNKLMAKALRLAAELIVRGRRCEIADGQYFQYLDINNFHIALHLDRALERGPEVAREYFRLLVESGQRRGDLDDIDNEIFNFVSQSMEDGSFVFRFANPKVFATEGDYFADKLREYDEENSGEDDPRYAAEKKYGSYAKKFD